MNSGKQKNQRGFTLPELMIALCIGGVVLTTITMLLVQSFRIWREQMSYYYVAQQSRILRENILRGGVGFGLREARLANFDSNPSYGDWQRINFDTPDGEKRGLFIHKQNWFAQPVWCGQDGAGDWYADWEQYPRPSRIYSTQEPLSVTLISNSVGQVNREFTLTYYVSVKLGDNVYTNTQRIKTFLVN